MIAPYSTIYQILHSRPDNTVTQFEVIQFEATFDRNINVDFKDKCLQIANTCFKFKLWVFSLLTLSHQQQAAHSSQRAKHQQSSQSTIFLSFWPFYSGIFPACFKQRQKHWSSRFRLFHSFPSSIEWHMTQSQLVFSFQSQGVSKILRACRNFVKVSGVNT